MTSEFKGFGSALRFLEDLAENNERAWFEENKARYEADVREPARAFVRAMAPRLAKVLRQFLADDRKVGGSIMRIHKDVRFAKDKTPYKTNLGIQFRHRTGKDVHAPGLYVHIQPGTMFLGAGMWRPEPEALQGLRAAIAASPSKWRKVVDDPALLRHWRQAGAALKRPPRGFDANHPLIEDLKRTDFILDAPVKLAEAKSARLVAVVADAFALTAPYLKFQCSALKIDF
jgi:uncharacterized protein (TIGR02453 family)